MAENTENVEMVENKPVEKPAQTEAIPQTFTLEQVEEIKKEYQTKGYVSGKKETNAKWEKTIAEEKAAAKKQAELEKMSEIERVNLEKTEAIQQAEEYKRSLDLLNQKNEVSKVLQEEGVSLQFIDNVLVLNDMEKTKENIKALKQLLDAEIQKGIEARIQVQVPKQNQGEATSDRFRKMMGL